MPESKVIRGRIVRILNAHDVIVNLGSAQGVGSNSLFHILGTGEKVTDPETGEVLGVVKVVKGKVKATQVFDRFTVATTRGIVSAPKGSLDWETIFSGLSGRGDVDQGGLKVDPAQITPWKVESEEVVKVGDLVEVTVTASTKEPQTPAASEDDEEKGGDDAPRPPE